MLIDSLFLLLPMSELPLLDHSARLDMLDYYAASLPARATNALGGESVLTAKTDSTLSIHLTDVSDWQLTVLPDGTLLCTHTLHVASRPDIVRKIEYIRKALERPGQQKVFFGIDVIVGFPGETDELFQ